MPACCDLENEEILRLRGKQRDALVMVLWINLFMFLLEFSAGLWADSSALLADSLDMLGDFLTYGFSLYVLARSDQWQSRATLLKGMIQAAFGIGVMLEVLGKLMFGGAPSGLAMGAVGGLALIANTVCLLILLRHREDNLNMKSVWLCSRNDVIGNLGVLVAAALVYVTHSVVPDMVVGTLISIIFLRTAFFVIRAAVTDLQKHQPAKR
ncbi:cation transporter [candidate division KSB1 bacterium]|nr:cation transporter [candidate division KSB1 bacterium]NIW69323.1 cation transporter [candidate division KSB1 bacterium]